MKKLIIVLIVAIVVVLIIGLMPSPAEPERAEVAESAAHFEADNRCTFTLFDDNSVEAYVFLEDFESDIGTAITTYVINKLNADYDNYTVNGWFNGNDSKSSFYFVVEDSEINADKGFIGKTWDKNITQDAYGTILLMYSEECDIIDAAIAELAK